MKVPFPTQPDEVFDRYARLVTTTLGVPVGLVSLVSTDGQVFPGAVGLPDPWQQTRCTGLSHSFCQHVVVHDEPLVTADARLDPRLADNLAIDDIGVIAYAGFPLHDADGTAVGSLCAIDTQPRQWTPRELDVLADLAATAASELTLRRIRTQGAASRAHAQAATTRIAEITESMAVGYLSMDPDWRITYVNTEGRRVLGATGREIVGQVIWDLYPATVGTEYETNYRAAALTGQTVTFDAYYPAPLDAWYELRATPEAGPTGTGVALYFLDITARKAATEAAELAGRRLGAIGEVALALASAQDVTALVTTIAEQGMRALGADGGSVAVPDPSDPSVLLSYLTASYGPGSQADYGHLSVDTDLPACQAYRTGAPVVLPDRERSLAHSPLMQAVIASTGSTAWVSVPLRVGDLVLGALTAGWEAPQAFDAEQLDLVSTFASQCSQALVRISARDAGLAATAAARVSASQQAALVAVARALGEADDEDQVLAVVATHGLSLLGASDSGLCLPDGDGVRVLTTGGVPSDLRAQWQHLPADIPLPFAHSATTGAALYISDAAQALRLFPAAQDIVAAMGLQAQASTPLRARGRLLGSLSMGFTQARAWPPAEVELVEAFAALTAQALERIYARDDEHAATLQQATLVALAAALGQTQSEADVFAVVAARSIGLLGAFGSGMCLREPDGSGVRTLATETISSAVRDPLQHLPADYPMPIVDTAITGTSYFLVDRAEAAARFGAAERHYTDGGVQASAQVPLFADGQLLGSLSLAFAEARSWPPGDRAVVHAFAVLVAQALERIYARDAERTATAEIAQFSETLQRSLLTSPPEPDHLHIAVRYSPAAEQAQVGGDWYDAFITADGSTSLVIGDVTGHDRTAAAAMGQLRNLLRGIAYAVGDPPAAILTVLDHAAHDLAVDTTATAVLARLEQTAQQRRTGERLLRWSNAGHPPPLLIAPDGATSYLQAPTDLLLGISADIPRHDHAVVLAPGSSVLLYTDGLIERRGAPLQDGLDWLLEAVARVAHLPVDDLCDALLEQVGGQLEDDVALLALRAYPEDEPRPAEAGPGFDPREEAVLGLGTGV